MSQIAHAACGCGTFSMPIDWAEYLSGMQCPTCDIYITWRKKEE